MRLKDILAQQNSRHLDLKGGCHSCPRKRVDFVGATLRATRLIIVGEAPGEVETQTGEGFTGKSGQVYRKALADVGIPPEAYSLTNSVHCRPPGNETPKDSEVSCCMNEFVVNEVANYPLVVLAGSVAQNAFFPGNAHHVRGNLAYHPDFPNSRFFSMLHPAAIGYDPKRKDEFYAQVDRLARIYKGETEAKFTVVTGAEFRARFADFLNRNIFLCFDVESNQLESWLPGGELRSFAVASMNEVFSIDQTDPFWRTALQLMAAWLQNPQNIVLGQNIGFDLVWMESQLNFKCDLAQIHDLQVVYYQLKQSKGIGLKELVASELDGYRHLVVWPHLEKNYHHLKLYGGEDVFYPIQLFQKSFPQLRPKTKDLITRVLGPSALSTVRMTHAGIYFRSEEWTGLNEEYEKEREAAIATLEREDPLFDRSYVTAKGFTGLEHYLYTAKKCPVIALTDKEQKPSTDDSTVKELIRMGYTELKHVLTIKNIDKRRSTYILPLPKRVAPDRRIHAKYHYNRTDTGRESSSDPNMQNNPRLEANRKHQVRWLFGAPTGYTLVQGDFSQIELRIAFSLANDPAGIEVYRRGGDVHIETAKFVLGNEPADPKMWKKDPYWIEQRFKAKSANFALIYGGQPYTLQQYAMNEFGVIVSDDDAKNWHKGFFRRYPALEGWHVTEIGRLRAANGYMESAVGHVWYYPGWNSSDQKVRSHEERAAINMTCQGPASYMMTYLIYLTQQTFWKRGIRSSVGAGEVVLTVHDSLDAEVATEQAVEAEAIVQECLHKVEEWVSPWFKVPLILDTSISSVWDKEDE